MRRTTLIIDERQFAGLKTLAAEEGRMLSSLTKELLELVTARCQRRRRKLRPLPSFKMGKFNVDISDRDALYKAMEGDNCLSQVVFT